MLKVIALALSVAAFGGWFKPDRPRQVQISSRGAASQGAAVLESVYSDRDFDLLADWRGSEWRNAPAVMIDRDYFGQPNAGPPTEVRSRWSDRNLYFLFICPYAELNLKPNPTPLIETPQLWNWDVAEVFIGWDVDHIAHYKELQVSPQSEWVDLDIDRDNPSGQEGMKWNSGFAVRGRIDAERHTWYGEMRIPFSAIDPRPPQKGRELRMGLFRIAGVNPRNFYAWRPPGEANFHVPKAFGTLRLK